MQNNQIMIIKSILQLRIQTSNNKNNHITNNNKFKLLIQLYLNNKHNQVFKSNKQTINYKVSKNSNNNNNSNRILKLNKLNNLHNKK